MVVLAEHHVTVTVHTSTPIHLDVSRMRLALDEEWVPYVQASLDCPLGDGQIATIDPQASDIRATVTVRRVLGRIDRISDITRRYRGRTIAAITTAFRGGTLADITRSLYHDYETPGAARREERREFKLMVRAVSIDRNDATASLTLASGEARLEDWAHMSPSTDRVPGADLIAKLEFILQRCGFTEGITYAPGTVPADAQIGDEAMRAPGSTALDFVNGLTRHHGLMLWCDEAGLWHLATDRTSTTLRTLHSAGADRSVVAEVETRSRDENWVTAVMLIWTWDGVDHYDIYSPWTPNPERALIRRYNAPFPGPGRAEQMFRLVTGRGRALDLDAVSEYAPSPGENVRYITPRGTVTGRLASIQWQFPDDEMSIRLREVGAA